MKDLTKLLTPATLAMARKSEAEHSKDVAEQDEIILDHIYELTDNESEYESVVKAYYSGLKKLEKNILGKFLNK